MRTQEDVLRSIRRYVSLVLGPTWQVRNWTDEGSFAPPLARVAPAGPATYRSRRVVTDIVLPVQVHFYLVPGDTVTEAMRSARLLTERVLGAIEIGIDQARPRRIPLYDYEGLTEAQGSDKRNYYDYLKVEDLSINTVADSDVPTGVVVIADIRVAWSQYTTVDPGGVTVDFVRVTTSAS